MVVAPLEHVTSEVLSMMTDGGLSMKMSTLALLCFYKFLYAWEMVDGLRALEVISTSKHQSRVENPVVWVNSLLRNSMGGPMDSGLRKRSQPQNQSRVKNLRALGTLNLKTSRGPIASGLWQEIPTSKHLQCRKSRGLGEAPTPKQPTLMTMRYIPSILTTAYSEGKWKHRTKPEYWEVRS